MSVRSTKLSTILARMDRFQAILQNSNEVYKVRDIDEEIRAMRRLLPMPWTLKKSSMRVFDGVYTYAVASDHDELAYLDVSENVYYPSKARFRYTSLIQFFEDSSNRNQIAEIWNGGQRYLGVNYKDIKNDSLLLNNAETIADWTSTGDVTAVVADTVFYKEGNGSVKATIVSNTGVAGIRNALSSVLSDTLYKRKYQFKWIYLSSVPTSIELRLETSAANYLSTSGITTQFDGSPLQANQWNLIAQDLNTATENGTFDSSSIAYERVVLTGADSGDYYIDSSYLREWTLMDYWYYSIYNVIASGGTLATKEYFYDDNSATPYDTNDELLGDSEWIDCIMYGAMLTNLIDIKDKATKEDINLKRAAAWSLLIDKYPSLDPVIIQDRYNFEYDFITPKGV